MKYENGYSEKLGQPIDLPEIVDRYEKAFVDGACFNLELKCPICRSVELVVVKENSTIFLRGKPNQVHVGGCVYGFSPISKKTYLKMENEIEKSPAKAKQMLEQLWIQLSRSETNVTSGPTSHSRNSPSVPPSYVARLSFRTPPFPIKRIDLPLNFEEDLDHTKIFYGTCNISFYDNDEGKGFLYLYHLKTKKRLCKIRLNQNVMRYFPAKYRVTNKNIFIGFIGKLYMSQINSNPSLECILEDSRRLLIHENP